MTLRKPLTSKLTSNRTLASICDGRVRLERLPTSGIISARAWIQGKDIRKSTGERTLTAAKQVATEWWQDLSVRVRRGEQVHSPTFADCATKFLGEAGTGCGGRAHQCGAIPQPATESGVAGTPAR